MFIKSDGVVTIIAGREGFCSSFRSGKKRTRNTAHKNLITEMEKRGYYSNGKRRQELPEFPVYDPEKIAENPEMGWAQMLGGMEEIMALFTKTVGDLGKMREPHKFWENPDTGDKIPVEHLMAATDLWPMKEVLELVPSEKVTPAPE